MSLSEGVRPTDHKASGIKTQIRDGMVQSLLVDVAQQARYMTAANASGFGITVANEGKKFIIATQIDYDGRIPDVCLEEMVVFRGEVGLYIKKPKGVNDFRPFWDKVPRT